MINEDELSCNAEMMIFVATQLKRLCWRRSSCSSCRYIDNINKDSSVDPVLVFQITCTSVHGITFSGSGIPFGEVALMSDDCIRTASIIAEEKTFLLVVDRTLYDRCVSSVLATEFREKQNFIQNNPLFKSWMPKYKKQLAMAMYKETWPYDSVLVRQGDPVTNIYFVIR